MRGELLERYDGVLLDLDGTVYRGAEGIPGAADSVAAALQRGHPICYLTNNASRAAADVAAHLVALGLTADAEHVVTSAQAGAALLAERLEVGSPVLVVGTEALADEVRGIGLRVVRRNDDAPVAVIQGHSPDTGWPDLAEACLAIRDGALWVACNVDATLPTERGELPGNGAMVAALVTATGLAPVVAGKPERSLMDQACVRLGMRHPLVVGDRLDTDVAGANAAGMDALLVLTGVSTPAELLAAPARQRPRYVGTDLTALYQPAARTEITDQADWTVEVTDESATLGYRDQLGSGPADPLAALHALCAALWSAGAGHLPIKPADDTARAALTALGLG